MLLTFKFFQTFLEIRAVLKVLLRFVFFLPYVSAIAVLFVIQINNLCVVHKVLFAFVNSHLN